jgi:hypothetical protein
MSYLYGDSTPSPLEVDFIDFLRDGLDFCVQLALSTDALQRESERGEMLRHAARRDVEQLEKLSSGVASAVKSFSNGESDGRMVRCAEAVLRSTSDLVKGEVQGVNSALEVEVAKLEVARAGEREKCVRALEALLLRHDLPSSSASLHLKANGSAPYAAELHTATPLGVAATIELDVPSSHLFGHVVRVDRIVDRLEVRAPEVAGWLHKEEKMRAQRLEKLYVIELGLGAEESSIKLRAAADGSGPGFDVLVSAGPPRVRLLRVAERDGVADSPFQVGDEDARGLFELSQKLEASAQDLAGHRKALLSASLDDRPLRDHDAPTLLVERLIQAIAPVVRDIAARSPSPGELVLKRLVTGGRREEIFVAKSELREKLERLTTSFRALFDPLGLGDERAGATPRSPPLPSRSSPPRSNEPPPLPVVRRPSGSDLRAVEPARSISDGVKPDVTVEKIDAGFKIIDVQDEKSTAG